MELGTLVGTQLDLRRLAEPVLRDLSERTKETVHMVVLDRNEVVYIDKIDHSQDTGGLKMASRLGSRNPIHSCAVGKALLSLHPEGSVEEMIRKSGLPKRTENTITDPQQFKDHLKAVKAQGYALDDEENERGVRCLAAPIFDGKGYPMAAISVSGPAFRVTRKILLDVIKKEVVQAAAEISRRLGYKEETGDEAR
jgi:DNA-binding IclR family transcriptional regulator